jgi:hypothetical protein
MWSLQVSQVFLSGHTACVFPSVSQPFTRLSFTTCGLQKLLLERLSSDYGLTFGAIARKAERDAVALSPSVSLQELMETEERHWHAAKLPLYLDKGGGGEGGEHVADLFVSVVAHQALKHLWTHARGHSA